jgi:lysophospholipase L1-like esterase
MKLAKYLLLVLFISITHFAFSQEPPFWNDVQAFKKQDSVHMPPQHEILFVGSSSFTKWTDVQNYFPDHPIINRGFGGSTLLDVMMYADDVILPYNPKQIVIYCGENDLAYSDTVSAQTVANRFIALFDIIRHVWQNVPVDYISIKPSPSRAKLMPKMVEANNIIQSFLKTRPNTAFIDVYHKMLNANGKPISEIFGPDSLHMNAKGYAIWQKEIAPHLSEQ